MKFIPTNMPDIIMIRPQIFYDARGFFVETYNEAIFEQAGITSIFLKDNWSSSKQGVLRGLHYQFESPQGKLIWVMKGVVFDVVVDLRKSSNTFGEWMGIKMSSHNNIQLWVPPGFAHGFYTLSKKADVIYKTTNYYDPTSEYTILWNDPHIGIEWPLINRLPPILSIKDAAGKYLTELPTFD